MLTEWVIPEFGEFECDYVSSNLAMLEKNGVFFSFWYSHNLQKVRKRGESTS